MDVLIAACGGAFVAGVFNLIAQFAQQRTAKKEKADDKADAVKDALKVLMLDRVAYLGKSHIKAGNIGLDDLTTLHKMHDAYKALGGNGDLNWTMAEVDKLKLKED